MSGSCTSSSTTSGRSRQVSVHRRWRRPPPRRSTSNPSDSSSDARARPERRVVVDDQDGVVHCGIDCRRAAERRPYGWPYNSATRGLPVDAVRYAPATGSSAPKTAVPATNTRRARGGARRRPSRRRSRRPPRAPARADQLAQALELVRANAGRNAWPPQPGFTVMHSTRSTSPTSSRDGLGRRARVQMARPARQPALADRLQRVVQVRRGLGVDRDAVRPRLGERLDLALGALDHQVHVDLAPAAWTWSASASTTSGPIVIGGTKWPSMMSTWIVARAGREHGRDLLAEAREVGGQDRRARRRSRPADQIGWSIELRQWLHA